MLFVFLTLWTKAAASQKLKQTVCHWSPPRYLYPDVLLTFGCRKCISEICTLLGFYHSTLRTKRAQISFTPRWKPEITHMYIRLPLKFLADFFFWYSWGEVRLGSLSEPTAVLWQGYTESDKISLIFETELQSTPITTIQNYQSRRSVNMDIYNQLQNVAIGFFHEVNNKFYRRSSIWWELQIVKPWSHNFCNLLLLYMFVFKYG